MDEQRETCWSLIEGAADGRGGHLERFVARYQPIVRAYLEARWRGTGLQSMQDDAIQEVFIDCIREGGVLGKARSSRISSFRAFLLGAVRNIALRFEQRQRTRESREKQAETDFDAADPDGEDKRLSRAFDRAWAESIVREAAERQADRAKIIGPDAEQRVKILDLHFNEGLKIRDVAEQLGLELKAAHRAYERARREFEESLRDVMAFHYPGENLSTEKEMARLLELMAE